MVSESEILTPRGALLAGDFVSPVDTADAAVLFSHSVLQGRSGRGQFIRLAAAYRRAGYATLTFDYSGHGRSSDDVITVKHQVEDLRAASGWLHDQGFGRQVLHADSFGTLPAWKARPPAVQTMVLVGAVTGPLNFEWDQILSPDQLEQLEDAGVTSIRDDALGPREYFQISRQTLLDLSLNDKEDLVDGLPYPVLLVHDAMDGHEGKIEMTAECLPLLPTGSRVEADHNVVYEHGQGLDQLAEWATAWATRHVPPRR